MLCHICYAFEVTNKISQILKEFVGSVVIIAPRDSRHQCPEVHQKPSNIRISQDDAKLMGQIDKPYGSGDDRT